MGPRNASSTALLGILLGLVTPATAHDPSKGSGVYESYDLMLKEPVREGRWGLWERFAEALAASRLMVEAQRNPEVASDVERAVTAAWTTLSRYAGTHVQVWHREGDPTSFTVFLNKEQRLADVRLGKSGGDYGLLKIYVHSHEMTLERGPKTPPYKRGSREHVLKIKSRQLFLPSHWPSGYHPSPDREGRRFVEGVLGPHRAIERSLVKP